MKKLKLKKINLKKKSKDKGNKKPITKNNVLSILLIAGIALISVALVFALYIIISSPDFDKEKLYKNMVDARADWLYELPQWEKIFDENTRKRLYKEQKNSGTIRKEKKIGRNDPCPCGSGKKYKKCCGRNA